MTFASEQLYKGYLRRNMPTIVSKVKVREIVPHLPCLTDHDRENIEAKRETYGNYDSMVLLLDCLKRRDNWPEQFIAALEACDHLTLAQEVRREYDALRATQSSNPSSPSATVVRAHVHPAPPAAQLAVAESGGDGPAAAVPAAASASLEATPPLQDTPVKTVDLPSSEASVAASEEVPPTDPVVAPTAPSTPPPSPEIPPSSHYPQQETTSPQQEDVQVLLPHVIGGAVEVDASQTASLVEASKAETEEEVQQSPSLPPADDGSPDLLKTPQKPPIQDSAPAVAVLEPEETSEPADTQALGEAEDAKAADAKTTVAPGVEAAPPSAQLNSTAQDSSLFDKPGTLVSVQPENRNGPTHDAPGSPVEPYSGNSERLEISSVSACAAVIETSQARSASPCLENGLTAHNEPEENHYESPGPSLDVREDVVQVFQEPCVLNLDGQQEVPQPQLTNGKPVTDVASALPLSTTAETVSSATPPSHHHQSEAKAEGAAEVQPQLKILPAEEHEASNHILSSNTKYIMTAAGVGACALLMAWKFKH